MNASDVMVRDPITIGREDDVTHAIKLLLDNDISALPVVDEGGRVIGILSEADLIRRDDLGTEKKRSSWIEAFTPSHTLAADYTKAHGRKVYELMSTDVVSASEGASLADIATLLEKHRIKRVPILKDGKIVGVVSRSNLIQALASVPTLSHPALETDRSIRLEILSQLRGQHWTGFGERNVVVAHGIVHLWGFVGSTEEREALKVLAEAVPGVESVSDEMLAAS